MRKYVVRNTRTDLPYGGDFLRTFKEVKAWIRWRMQSAPREQVKVTCYDAGTGQTVYTSAWLVVGPARELAQGAMDTL